MKVLRNDQILWSLKYRTELPGALRVSGVKSNGCSLSILTWYRNCHSVCYWTRNVTLYFSVHIKLVDASNMMARWIHFTGSDYENEAMVSLSTRVWWHQRRVSHYTELLSGLRNYIKPDSKLKPDTNWLQFNLKLDICHTWPSIKNGHLCPACLALLCLVLSI